MPNRMNQNCPENSWRSVEISSTGEVPAEIFKGELVWIEGMEAGEGPISTSEELDSERCCSAGSSLFPLVDSAESASTVIYRP